jgi:hypothetical protein
MRFFKHFHRVTIILLFAFSHAIAQDKATERPLVAIEGTGLSLQQPNGFERAEAFHGFQQESTGSSVMVTVIPGSFSEVTKGFTKETLAKQGIGLLSKRDVRIANRAGLLLNLSQSAYGQEFQKWISVAGDETKTQVVTATFPTSKSGELSEAMRSVVLSATPSSTTDDTPSLPFEIGTVEGLANVKRIAAIGKMVAFTKDGRLPASQPTDPLFIVAPSLGNIPIADQRTFAERRLNQTAHTKIDSIESVSDVSIDRTKGIEIEAIGRDQKSEKKLMVYQVILFPKEGGYILMTGLVGNSESNDFLPKFKSLARSYRTLPNVSK